MRIVPLVLSALVLAAHFYRSGNLVLAGAVAASPLLLLVRKNWVVAAIQVALFVAAAEWVRTALAIASERAVLGQPSTRMFLILGSVAVLTALSAIPLNRLRYS